jgi:hypothetical protein
MHSFGSYIVPRLAQHIAEHFGRRNSSEGELCCLKQHTSEVEQKANRPLLQPGGNGRRYGSRGCEVMSRW